MCIKTEFEKQVEKTPKAIALIHKSETLTYEELNSYANGLAMYLTESGVCPGDIIGIYMSRNIEIIVAKLAIIKCGASYLPLDKKNPAARNLHQLDVVHSNLIISDVNCELLLNPSRRSLEIDFDKFDSLCKNSDAHYKNPQVKIDNEECAYIMFTSGSTGEPKGVMVPHRGVLRLIKNTNYIKINDRDRILQFSSLSFDASTFEIWGALLNGAALVLYPGDSLDPNLLADEIDKHRVSILFLTTALFHIMATRFISAFTPLRVLLAGGDVLNPSVVNKVSDALPELSLVICYGPTENTTFTTTHEIKESIRPDMTVPIGAPISGTSVHVLDENMEKVSPGETGELCVSGLGVALGYTSQKETNKYFFTNNEMAQGLLYKTGDLVKTNDAGDLEFIGRVDNQVKIRGFRASIEEIQNHILKLDAVNDVFLSLDKYESGDQLLSAYITLEDGENLRSRELKSMIADLVPEYMIPDRILLSKEFPLNKNGKICKKSIRETIV